MLSSSAAVAFGAVGGLVVEAVFTGRRLQAWQQARYRAKAAESPLPAITKFIDPGADVSVAFTRAVLGCLAGFALHAQVSGMYAALAVGASAPALLANLAKVTKPSEIQQGEPKLNGAGPPGQTLARPPDPQPEAAE